MKVVIIDAQTTADFDPNFEHRRPWPDELRAAVDEADVVIGMFSPHAPRILKGPEGLELAEFRTGRTKSMSPDGEAIPMRAGVIRLEGSRDEEECAAQNERLKSTSREGWLDQGQVPV